MTNLLDGQPVPLYGDGGNVRLQLTAVLLECCGAERDMGYALLVPFRQRLEETVRWYAGDRAWWEPLKRLGAAPGTAGSGQMS